MKLRGLHSRCISERPPTMRRSHRHFIAWITALAVLLSVVTPSLARTLTLLPGTAASWVDICTGSGFPRLAASTGDRSDGGDPVAAVSAFDCPCCTTQGGAVVLPSAPQMPIPAATAGLSNTTLARAAPCAPLVWASARPRAPPGLA
jgi:hypothetical protein